MRISAPRRTGGRPTAQAAVRLEVAILDEATRVFLADGYAATTIEAIARTCGVAKRTIYARWSGKPALFRAVLERLMERWLSTTGEWGDGESLEAALKAAADAILAVALTPQAIALHRLIIAESGRIPELPLMLRQAGANEGVLRIAALLDHAVTRGDLPPMDTAFAAEQFLHLLLVGPQRRAMGLGRPFDREAIIVWRDKAIILFLSGIGGLRLLTTAE
jgi:TetR/AcrR family transcriptional regulator, mexJK operon transcriptional repressor